MDAYDHMIKQKHTAIDYVHSHITLMGRMMESAARGAKFKTSTDFAENGTLYRFYVDFGFSGYAKDGSTIIYPENNTRIYVRVLVSNRRTVWVSVSDEFVFEEELDGWEMTGNHDSCFMDGWDRELKKILMEAFASVIPEGYWEHKQHSNNPVHIFFAPEFGFGKPVWIKHERDPDQENSWSYVRKVTEIRDYTD